ncbi:hypothetical protein [Natrinema soli]|uniref:Uncharacterized protein n=1 Tax=Natrinema soli TaxID=1930624 RepID=A0ABD5SGC6_9EURY|nr:hypothetical protein [Natrinema soli]
MSDSQLHDRVHEVLNEADAFSGSIVSSSDSGSEDDSSDERESAERDLLETAREASDLLESADPAELLAAVGLDTLEDGSEPDSIPEAIARGEQENLEDLRRLLHLAKLADRADDGSFEGAVGDLRETMSERAESGADEEAETEENNVDEDTPDDESTASEDEAVESEADETADDLGDRLRSSMQSSFEQFGDDVQQLKERLESASAGSADTDTAGDAQDADVETADEATAEEATDEEETADDTADEEDADGDDEGLLGSGLGGDEDRGTASGGPSRHSTMAPPPSKRADMRTTTRHSTMPDKHG